MTCKDCIHNDVCYHLEHYGRELEADKPCEQFKLADEVVHSKWILYTDGSGECERCHMRQKNVWDFEGWQNFCGYCGAKMDGEEND